VIKKVKIFVSKFWTFARKIFQSLHLKFKEFTELNFLQLQKKIS